MTVETITTDPVPVPQAPRKGAGRPADPNPFIDQVREIAGKLNERTGQAMTVRKTFTLNAERGETLKQCSARIRRQLTAAGEIVAAERGLSEPYRIGKNIAESRDVPGVFVLTYWDREIHA